MQTDQLLTPTIGGDNTQSAKCFSAAAAKDQNRQQNTNTDCVSKALEIYVDKKRAKISVFLARYRDNLEAHLGQLSAFACSTNGLLGDEHRERIWPVLAKNIPRARRYDNTETPTKSFDDGGISSLFTDDEHLHPNLVTDSDFESALSTFSSSSFGNGGRMGEENDLDFDGGSVAQSAPEFSLEQLRAHKEWNQVELDVARTLARFPPNIENDERAILQKELTQLIVHILCENEQYRYYQGFHDICLTFLLVLGGETALDVTRAVCQRGAFYNYLSCTLEESALRELQDLYVLLFMHDQEVEKRLRNAELGTLFALSWPLTWFSHALQEYTQVVQFFDLFLCSHQLMPIYVSAALISERRLEVLSCEPDMPYLHQLLNHIPSNINCNRIIDVARSLMDRYPPGVLCEMREEYARICDRHRRLMAVEQMQKRIQIAAARRKSSSASLPAGLDSLVSRYNIYKFTGVGVAFVGVGMLYYIRSYLPLN